VTVKVYVEGGGESDALQTRCREGFTEFFRHAGLTGRMPRVVASGSRRRAYERFRKELQPGAQDKIVILLVDSEDPVPQGMLPWEFLRGRRDDGWERPAGASDESAHLMVQCMEAWFLADKDALSGYFGQGFRQNAFPERTDIEAIPKPDLMEQLKQATRDTKTKGEYRKRAHSFQILGMISPELVRRASPHADRLLKTLATVSQP